MLASRRLTPLILGWFALLYVVLAFRTDEALMALMELVRGTPLLLALLALVPLNAAARLVGEARSHLLWHRMVRGDGGEVPAGFVDEEVVLPEGDGFAAAEEWLRGAGYRVTTAPGLLAARRGISAFPARILFLLSVFSLFTGIILSFAARTTVRDALVEGEPLPPVVAAGGSVTGVSLRERPEGIVFARTLSIGVAGADGSERTFGLYPPGRLGGLFVYPRYLGVAPRIRFAAPDFRPGIDTYAILMIHPPGREDSLAIPGTPYRLVFRLAEGTGGDPYVDGSFNFVVRVEKGRDAVAELAVPSGGSVERDGYLLAVPGVKRMVAADFIRDQGVPLVWGALLLAAASAFYRLFCRLFVPRREIVMRREGGWVRACSRAEGGDRRHAGLFHETLDRLSRERMG
ncbi:hypothetical protein GPICK_15890 [Geobacter pickeringii]|uniref:ResB-like domain-containing protein n=1 Tax=Geobacter pickeringii TaxID=345632 RepID=A0A0B5BKF7_9BACT|nr:hypothetical protein GPICK_15890 [Geobacter pickeringii]